MKRTREEMNTNARRGAIVGKKSNKQARQEVSIEVSPKRRTSPGRVADFREARKFLISYNDDMDYLEQEYGIIVEAPKLPSLPRRERAIATNLARLLKLIEEHLGYWSKKNAPVTQDALHKAKTLVFGLLDAI